MAKMKGLGKGLDALLGDDFTNEPEVKSSLFLPISQVESCASQPRKQFDPDALADLADSIRQHGIIQPLTVRKLASGYYQIIAGERRWRASQMAGLTAIPAYIRTIKDENVMELALVENLQRKNLDFIEEANGLSQLIKLFGMSQEEAARRLGKSQSAVANKLRLLRFSAVEQEFILANGLSERHARAALRVPDPDERLQMLRIFAERGLNVAAAEEYVESMLCAAERQAKPAPPEIRHSDRPLPRRRTDGGAGPAPAPVRHRPVGPREMRPHGSRRAGTGMHRPVRRGYRKPVVRLLPCLRAGPYRAGLPAPADGLPSPLSHW